MTDVAPSGWAGTIKGMPAVGAVAERRRRTRAEDIAAFTAITGDRNPPARAEVTSVRPDKPICTLATTILNEAGEPCLTGTATTYTVPLR
jgi:acyl dehydratase